LVYCMTMGPLNEDTSDLRSIITKSKVAYSLNERKYHVRYIVVFRRSTALICSMIWLQILSELYNNHIKPLTLSNETQDPITKQCMQMLGSTL